MTWRTTDCSTAADLVAMRKAADWTQLELAGRAGVHVQTVKYWENKPGRIGGHAVARFREAFAAAGIEPREDYSDITTREKRTCGARTRQGAPCKAKPVEGKARCKFHGGMSTGPRTPEGRERIRQAQLSRWSNKHDTDHRPAA